MKSFLSSCAEKIAKFIMYILPLCLLSFGAHSYLVEANVVYATNEVVKEVVREAPVLERIADCESGVRNGNGKAVKGSASHYGKSGQVLMTPNANHTVDVGKYAINTAHFKTAADMGYDLTLEADNKAFAEYLYATQGTEPWYPSKNCWK